MVGLFGHLRSVFFSLSCHGSRRFDTSSACQRHNLDWVAVTSPLWPAAGRTAPGFHLLKADVSVRRGPLLPSCSLAANESSNPTLALLRSKYALLDKAEWWWLFDDALEEIGKCLTKDNFVLVDGFLPPAAVAACRGEIDRARREGRLEPGGLAGGTAGRATSYSLDAVRGDLMGWWSGDEPELGWSAIPAYLRKARGP